MDCADYADEEESGIEVQHILQGTVNDINGERFGRKERLVGRADDAGGGAEGSPMGGV